MFKDFRILAYFRIMFFLDTPIYELFILLFTVEHFACIN